MKNRYKVLNLPFPFSCHESDEEWEMMVEDLVEIYKKIEPVFNRTGWYFDRQTGKSWIETNKGCWELPSPRDFEYDLERYSHKRIPRAVREAIKVLMNYKMCPNELKQWLWRDAEIQMLHDTYWGAMLWRLRNEEK
jgi:hypothetical protein